MGIFIIVCAVVISAALLAFAYAYDLWECADAVERQNAMLQESETK